MMGNAAHVFANGHLIVIEHNHNRLPAVSGIVQPLIGHAAGCCTIAHQGNHLIRLLLQRSCPCHAQGNGHGAGSMTRHKGIGNAFLRLGEAGHPAKLAQGGKILPPSGEELVDIGLMPYVKHQTVLCGVVYGFQCHRQLHHAQVACQMAAGLGNAGY